MTTKIITTAEEFRKITGCVALNVVEQPAYYAFQVINSASANKAVAKLKEQGIEARILPALSSTRYIKIEK